MLLMHCMLVAAPAHIPGYGGVRSGTHIVQRQQACLSKPDEVFGMERLQGQDLWELSEHDLDCIRCIAGTGLLLPPANPTSAIELWPELWATPEHIAALVHCAQCFACKSLVT